MAKQSLILGYGVSGHGAEKLLLARKKSFSIWDDSPEHSSKNPDIKSLNRQNYDEVIVSPGISPSHPIVVKAIEEKIPLYTELDLALKENKKPVIAITGTNGKSTTTAMITHGLRELGHSVMMAGNIGTPLAEYTAKGESADFIVLELSSYQLHYLHKHPLSCVVFTNFSADHDAWHGSHVSYFQAKWKVLDFVKESGHAVVGADVLKTAKNLHFSTPPDLNVESLSSGSNADFAAKVLEIATKCTREKARSAILNFKGLAHRIELLGAIKSKPVWNDSKATNFESTLYAIQNVNARPFVLLLGGRLKNNDFSLLQNLDVKLRKDIAHIYTFGESHKKLEEALSNQYPLTSFANLNDLLDDVLPKLRRNPQPLLFSPGGSSFDEFRNFADRGDFFRARIAASLD